MFIRKKTSRNNTNVYNVMDVVVYIVKYCDAKNRQINNITLQKLLYFVQAYFMTQTQERQKLFDAKFVAWEFGPACPAAYYELQHHVGNLASVVEEYSIIKNAKPFDYTPQINDNDKVIINAVLDYYLNFSSSGLIVLSRNQDPWINTPKGEIIEDQLIIKYFSRNKQPIMLSNSKRGMTYV